jgi:hypothetical protein
MIVSNTYITDIKIQTPMSTLSYKSTSGMSPKRLLDCERLRVWDCLPLRNNLKQKWDSVSAPVNKSIKFLAPPRRYSGKLCFWNYYTLGKSSATCGKPLNAPARQIKNISYYFNDKNYGINTNNSEILLTDSSMKKKDFLSNTKKTVSTCKSLLNMWQIHRYKDMWQIHRYKDMWQIHRYKDMWQIHRYKDINDIRPLVRSQWSSVYIV